MAAKKTASKSKKVAANKTPEGTDKPWFPTDAKPADPPAAPKKTSPWQRRAVLVNYGTLAKPGVSLRQVFDTYITENHKKLTDAQREQLWKAVGTKMLTEERTKLNEVIAQEISALSLIKQTFVTLTYQPHNGSVTTQ